MQNSVTTQNSADSSCPLLTEGTISVFSWRKYLLNQTFVWLKKEAIMKEKGH